MKRGMKVKVYGNVGIDNNKCGSFSYGNKAKITRVSGFGCVDVKFLEGNYLKGEVHTVHEKQCESVK